MIRYFLSTGFNHIQWVFVPSGFFGRFLGETFYLLNNYIISLIIINYKVTNKKF